MITKQKVLNIIREKNPETMELSLGCRVKYPSDKRYAIADELDNPQFTEAIVMFYGIDKGYDDSEEFFHVWSDWNEPEDLSGKLSEDELKIIGHPLYPVHLLVALGENYAITAEGMILERKFGDSAYDCAGLPMLRTAQPLEPQLDDEELCEKIYKLLSE